MFWGLIMEPKRRYTQVVKKPFHVSMAALDVFSSSEDPCQVMLTFEGRNYLLCTLQKDKTMQCALDLNFETGDKVILATNGDSNVHLTGYLVEEEMDMVEDADEEEEEDEEIVEVPTEIESNKKRRKVGKTEQQPPKKKSKTEKLLDEADNYDSNDDESFSLSKALEGDDTDESDEEDSDEEAEEQDDNMGEEDDDDDDDDDEEEEQESDEEFSSLSEEEEEKAQAKPQMNGVSSKRKQKETEKQNQQKKMKGEGEKVKNEKKGEKGGNVVKTPNKQNKTADDSIQKDNKTPKGDKTPKGGKQGDSPMKSPQQNVGSPQKRTLEGGLIVQDVVVGEGPIVKPGKLAFVYYEGRLKQNNKLFDKKLQGAPFKFRLGKQEVIKGWDVGVSGMKVGGKRKIICPPNMAYGTKGSPPEIPPNSTLVFEVELKNVK